MPGLLDVAESFLRVTIKGVDVEVPGIGAEGIAYLFHRFPIIRELIGGKSPDLSPEALTKLAPEAIAAIIAAGTGHPNDPETEAVAAKLSADDQLTLLEAIAGETMPKGVAPFVERFSDLFERLGVESTNIPDGTSLLPSKS
jgi:hypothetical protein